MGEMNAIELIKLLCADIDTSHGFETKPRAKRITCKDGESLSVQASSGHYCKPRVNRAIYYAVEVGFPSVSPPESWKEYFDGDWDSQDRTSSVYGYVPIDLVVDFINAHGGA